MFKKLTSFENLYYAYKDCLKRKRNTAAAQAVEPIYEKILWQIKRQLENKTWRPHPYRAFVVTYPTVREIFAAHFVDRIVHHALYRIVNPIFEKDFIANSYACRQGRGTHAALYDLRQALKEMSRYGRKPYFLKLDIKSFFVSIDKKILLAIVKRKIINEDVIWLIEKIILPNPADNAEKVGDLSLFDQIPRHKSLFYTGAGKGLPIGNLTSQLFANIYLNELDQFIKKQLKTKYYFRYVDDLVILNYSTKKLKSDIARIKGFLKKKLQLDLNMKKSFINEAKQGVNFLGYIIRAAYVLVRRKVIVNFNDKLYSFEQGLKIGGLKPGIINATVNSYFAHFRHANSFKLTEKFKKKVEKIISSTNKNGLRLRTCKAGRVQLLLNLCYNKCDEKSFTKKDIYCY